MLTGKAKSYDMLIPWESWSKVEKIYYFSNLILHIERRKIWALFIVLQIK